MEFQNFTSSSYGPYTDPPNGTTKVFSNMVHVYLGLVQPNPFPPDWLIPLIENSAQPDATKIAWYEAGYVACAIIGILFIVLMPVVGLFFSCCRCCNNCGGKMYQEQTKHIKCKRNYHYTALFLVTTIILAGNICMFVSNSNMTSAVNSSFSAFNNTVNNLNTYLTSIPQEINFILNSSNLATAKASSHLKNIGPTLGGDIRDRIAINANSTIDSVSSMSNVMYSSAVWLVAVNTSFNGVHNTQQNLSQQLSDVQAAIRNTLNSPSCGGAAGGCNSMTANDLTFDANFSTIPDFSSQYALLTDLNNTDTPPVLKQATDNLNSIPQQVTNQTQDIVRDVQKQLDNIHSELQNIRKDLSFTDSLQNVTSLLKNVTDLIFQQQSNVTHYEYIRSSVGYAVCCSVLLVVVCNIFGFFLGPIGLKANMDPTDRSCASNAGGNFFMAGASFSFIFSWLLMIVVLVFFLLGGNAYTFICKPWNDQTIFQVIDSPAVTQYLNLKQMLGVKNTTINVSSLYSGCQSDKPLWSVLQLYKSVPLDQYLDISKYENDINSSFSTMNITLNPIIFLTEEQKNLVRNISSSGLNTLDFSDIQNQMKKNMTKTNLIDYANYLQKLADNTTDPNVKANLTQEATNLTHIDSLIEQNLLPQIAILKQAIIGLQATTAQIQGSVSSALTANDATQNFIATQTLQIVKNESLNFKNTMMGYFHSYIAWANTTLRYSVGHCGPVGKVVNSTYVIACDNLVDSWNALWFSLGWCTIFLLPNVILAIKLAKYYRRMKLLDLYENDYTEMEMKATSEQFLIPRVAIKK